MGDFAAAATDAARAAELDPAMSRAHLRRAHARVKLEQYDAARAAVEAGAALAPSDAQFAQLMREIDAKAPKPMETDLEASIRDVVSGGARAPARLRWRGQGGVLAPARDRGGRGRARPLARLRWRGQGRALPRVGPRRPGLSSPPRAPAAAGFMSDTTAAGWTRSSPARPPEAGVGPRPGRRARAARGRAIPAHAHAHVVGRRRERQRKGLGQ
ncbi:hypothetical protein C2845_PM07G06380 [Panicum miliaceum]|uniref:Uncharacterized protein n=1 Tax=Panicum miliaceum TaxID=4540 RepID=A0A3L6STZ7_PANMI|nr:hypothetical protein C2845_PM07G06380 [Panicum miliaceum]